MVEDVVIVMVVDSVVLLVADVVVLLVSVVDGELLLVNKVVDGV